MTEYNASSIKILDGVELGEIPYMKINRTAQLYKKPIEIVEAAWSACQMIGLSFDEFYIKKYCKGEDLPMSAEFNEAFTEARKPYLDSLRTSKK